MRISIFGLGYVGCVTAACFAKLGNTITGVDVNQKKVDLVNQGKSPIVEPQLSELIKAGVDNGFIKATVDAEQALKDSDLSIICVGTPSKKDGDVELEHVKKVAEQLGKALNSKKSHIFVFRSTILPGTVEGILIPVLEKSSGLKAHKDFGVVFHPEFLREGSAVDDFLNPPTIVIGCASKEIGSKVAELYEGFKAPVFLTTIKEAETVKYVNNCFHALKIGFANEIGNVCKAYGVDSHKVMEMFCADKVLNLSPYYLKPGFAFGGSCLPKDLRAINFAAKNKGLEIPILEAILPSNELQKERVIDMITELGNKKIGILGLSFKPDTDDLRESPIIKVIGTLIGKGFEVLIYDENVSIEKLFGANLAFMQREIPYAKSILCKSVKEILDKCDVIVVANKTKEFLALPALLEKKHVLVDLVRIIADPKKIKARYIGICW